MFLDDVDYLALDPDNMRGHIDALPDQLESAWNRARTLDLPASFRDATRIVITGMGDSIIAADLLAALAEPSCPTPIFVNRDYNLPAFATGSDTLVIAMSYSGTTEETLSAAHQAAERGAQLLAITAGSALADQVTTAGGTVWRIDYQSQPRAALGWLYGLLLSAAEKLHLLPDLDANVIEAIERLRRDREVWQVDTLTNRNSAKRVAGQFVDRIPVIWGSGFLAPVARRWKTQFNANAKTAAFYETMPEVNHNAIVGIVAPEELINRHKIQIVQLVSAQYDHPRVFLRHESTDDMLREAGVISEIVKARGEGRLTQQMNLVQFGDYVSFFLAMANGVDPTPILPIDRLKQKMAEAS
jgi:glucose/mannose-6-phosphate isomerase